MDPNKSIAYSLALVNDLKKWRNKSPRASCRGAYQLHVSSLLHALLHRVSAGMRGISALRTTFGGFFNSTTLPGWLAALLLILSTGNP
jgi:hypothetical protein